jgi:hypothetical protein
MSKKENKFIDGIFNYCDRWCERCYMTARCRLFHNEKEMMAEIEREEKSDQDKDEENKALWEDIEENFKNVEELLDDIQEELNAELGLDDFNEENHPENKILEEIENDNHPLIKTAQEYSRQIFDWYNMFKVQYMQKGEELNLPNKTEEDKLRVEEALHIILWYALQIEVKIKRALSSKYDPIMEDPPEGFPTDADGSAKVAIIGISRSIGAYEVIKQHFPERYDETLKTILHLSHLLQFVHEVFPNANDCIRPGFDTKN